MMLVTGLQIYAIALGSNRRHGRHGAPAAVLAAALADLAAHGIEVLAVSPTIGSAPVGPSHRRYANAAALIATSLAPAGLLDRLKATESAFGRRRSRRWGARVLDLDIIFWSGGAWSGKTLAIPHPRWAERRFVVDPLLAIAADWRDPLSSRTVRHVAARLGRSRADR